MITTIAPDMNAMEVLITKACGNRSITAYAKSCGISPMHVSRLKSGICRPSRTMCVKLGSDSYARQMGITPTVFMKAAGYCDENETEDTNHTGGIEGICDTIALGLVSKALMSKGTTFQIVPCRDKPDVDFAFEVKDGTTILCMCDKVLNRYPRGMDKRTLYYYLIGRLFTLIPDDSIQYMMLLDDEKMFDYLVVVGNMKDRGLRARISLILVDYSQVVIRKEAFLRAGESFLSLL